MSRSTSILFTCLILLIAALTLRELDYRSRVANVASPVTVYVSGEVANPGAATLPEGARRLHAINLCGGLTQAADQEAADLARLLEDGETVAVPSRARPQSIAPELREAPVEAAPSSAERVTLNLNAATRDDLEALPGVGPVLAARILEARTQMPQGSFRSLEDLATIRGIKRKTLARLKPHLELEGL